MALTDIIKKLHEVIYDTIPYEMKYELSYREEHMYFELIYVDTPDGEVRRIVRDITEEVMTDKFKDPDFDIIKLIIKDMMWELEDATNRIVDATNKNI